MAQHLRSEFRDGKLYYIIGSGKNPEDAHVVICENIAQRNSLVTDGFVLVKNAGKDDPTITKGWGLYIRDVNGTTVTWIKIAEEETVNGIKDLEKWFLDQFATKSVLTRLRNLNDNDHRRYDGWESVINRVNELVHNHTNLNLLNSLDTKSGALTESGSVVGGTFYYDNIVDNKLVWKNPDDLSIESEGVEIDSSVELAERFRVECTLATDGLYLLIKEVDGSISRYQIVKNTVKFLDSVGSSERESVQFVTCLPEPSAGYVGKGVFYLLPPATCGNKANRFYRCVPAVDGNTGDSIYVWSDFGDSNNMINGPVINGYRKDWNTIHLFWEDVDEEITQGTYKYVYDYTVVVRKFGSAPRSAEDGIVVYKSNVRNEHKDTPFVDICPLSTVPVFYGVFSKSKNGYIYNATQSSTKEIKFITWSDIKTFKQTGKLSRILSVGDIITSPRHTKLGRAVDLMVTNISDENGETKIYLTSMDSVGKLPFDASEWALKPTTDTEMRSGVKYFSARLTSDGRTLFDRVTSLDAGKTPVGEGLFEGTTAADGVTITNFNPAFDSDNMRRHGSTVFVGSNIQRWLNSEAATNWFGDGYSAYDVNGIDYDWGYLNGFLGTGFEELIDKVILPSTESTPVAALTSDGSKWATGATNNAVVFNSGSFGGTSDPEVAYDIHPVFVIRY